MIKTCKGTIFDSGCESIVNPVNAVGVMGAGLAKQFKLHYPKMFHHYLEAYSNGLLGPGRHHIYLDNDPAIINFVTKRHWRNPSRLEDIELGLSKLPKILERLGIKSIALPKIGCGLGGLDWSVVRPRITHHLNHLEVELYE